MSHLTWIGSVFVILFLVWLFTGGPTGEVEKPFLQPPAPLGGGQTYGPSGSSVSTQGQPSVQIAPSPNGTPTETSLFEGQVALNAPYSGNSKNQNAEYLEIIASPNNTQPVNVSGWKLQSAITGRSTTIGLGTYLVYAGRPNTEQPIFLNPGERAFITTGRSPIGVSFKLNTCTGYLEQFQNFAPALPLQCPLPLEENLPTTPPNGLNDTCLEYLNQFPRCAAHVASVPVQLAGVCADYITEKVNYTGCVGIHKNDANFYKPEWRIFLGRDQELWKDQRETLYLLNGSGKLVSSVSY